MTQNMQESIKGCLNEEISKRESQIYEALVGVKIDADERVLNMTDMLNNESYFERMMISNVITRFKNEQKIDLNTETTKYINKLVIKEYITEFNGINHG